MSIFAVLEVSDLGSCSSESEPADRTDTKGLSHCAPEPRCNTPKVATFRSMAGHGTGAGIASVASMELMYKLSISAERVKLMTVGGPMVGDYTFANVHSEKVAYDDATASADAYSVCTTTFVSCYKKVKSSVYDNLRYFGKNILNYATSEC
ncbi:unnamed protein product [Toxocara canis]|uniref:Lipase_3 domain-containing protein n=1 Tax=Toxocara canis TaxID=6265 RepID=A0A183US14_TOXCA|nr:unnamed protein product [Toxocara canis]